VQPVIDKANEIDDRPVVIDFRTDSREKVFPMVAAGAPTTPSRSRRSSRRRSGSGDGRPPPAGAGKKLHTLSVLVENKAGVLARVATLFARRAYNIESLAVAPSDDERFSRITIVVDVEATSVEQITKQLFKLINVVKISELDPATATERELMLCTVSAAPEHRSQVTELVQIFEGRILAVGHDQLTGQPRRNPSKIDDFEELLRPYGIVELQRTGRVALPKLERSAPRLRPVTNKVG
jgi:acetolactate synthase-1/3 small subunit